MKRHDDSQRSGRLAMAFADLADLRVVDRVVASIASSPRLGFDGSMMKRHDDSQRSHRLAVTFGDPYESLTARRAYASLPRLGFSRMPMKRHNDSQRSDRLAMAGTSPPPVAATLAGGWNGRSPRLTWSGEPVTIGNSEIERMPMERHDDRQRSDRSVTRATSTVCAAGRGKVHEAKIAVDVSCAGPHTSNSRFNGSVMKRHDDTQPGDRLAVTFGDLRVVDRVVASIASSPRLGSDGSVMERHDDSQRSGRLAVTQPVHPPPPPNFFKPRNN